MPPVAPLPPVRRSSRKRGLITLLILVVVLAVIGIVGYIASRNAPSRTAVGDCMKGQDKDSLKKVACTDTTAEWKVVGRVSSGSGVTVETTCVTWPDATAVYWEGKEGQQGFALCLAPLNGPAPAPSE
jgi:hypothetical protein